MAVSKRTRFEVLRRDNFTCRYCRSVENSLKVDHVTPKALGGSDDPSNLVAACHDCNAGKSSTSPGEHMVADVREVDLQWSRAIKRVAMARSRQRAKEDGYCVTFMDYWNTWRNSRGEPMPMPPSWEASVRRFYELGVPIEELQRAIDVACGNQRISPDDTFRYFAGCAWRVVTEMQEAAKSILESEGR